ncbi:DUF465 domain-containing protein [bacterium]|nr:DUF465 domain-containing protein [bacterium]
MKEEFGVELVSRIDRLKEEHFSLELKIEEIRRKPVLSTEDHFKIRNLKKLKLMTKDKLNELDAMLNH